jgi:hypothetical protein
MMFEKALDRFLDRTRMIGPEPLPDREHRIHGAGPARAAGVLAQERTVAAIEFPDDSFDPVALDRAFDAMHADTESILAPVVGQVNQAEPMSAKALAVGIDLSVLPGFGKQA